MMMVNRYGKKGFRLHFYLQGRVNFSVRAKDVQEIQSAIAHHYGQLPCREGGDCPLCRYGGPRYQSGLSAGRTGGDTR